MNDSMVTFGTWKKENPEKWAQVEGSVTRNQMRTLKFLDAQIHLSRETSTGVAPPDTPEVRWLRRCVIVYLYVMAHGIFPADETSAMWVKNQRRGALCDYQVAALQQIPGWRWRPRRSSWDERARELDAFRDAYGRDPRVRSSWEHERAIAHWCQRQRQAASEGKLTPNQMSLIDGEGGQPTAEIVWAVPTFAGSYERWFREYWANTVIAV